MDENVRLECKTLSGTKWHILLILYQKDKDSYLSRHLKQTPSELLKSYRAILFLPDIPVTFSTIPSLFLRYTGHNNDADHCIRREWIETISCNRLSDWYCTYLYGSGELTKSSRRARRGNES